MLNLIQHDISIVIEEIQKGFQLAAEAKDSIKVILNF